MAAAKDSTTQAASSIPSDGTAARAASANPGFGCVGLADGAETDMIGEWSAAIWDGRRQALHLLPEGNCLPRVITGERHEEDADMVGLGFLLSIVC